MTEKEIAAKMGEITAEFQAKTGVPEAFIDNVILHCYRKIRLTNKPEEYILLLLPDELRNACNRSWINKRMMDKEAGKNVRIM